MSYSEVVFDLTEEPFSKKKKKKKKKKRKNLLNFKTCQFVISNKKLIL